MNKNQPSVNRIRFVLECMRISTETGPSFESTEDILSEEERELLLLIDKSLKIQPFDGQYKATIKINDTEIVRESTSAIQARNDACLATYECLFKLRISGNDGVECISRSIETAQVSKAPSLDSCSTNKAMLTKLSPTDMESYRERIIGT